MVQGALLRVLKHVPPPAVHRSMYKSSSAVKCFTVMGPWNSSQHHELATAMTDLSDLLEQRPNIDAGEYLQIN